ncbi:hypothetical protein JTE88_03560 [Arcanobacterium phocisimile]|uniref:Tetratricopeptide repeat-containing protein n=1 Tax=Arcanobacterium phocisimile TaxID=1302235 RepID=A0ABX7IJV5_9ACTO|nr:hypothetical protein [Arcanobacterium phocisimile]QRV02814.1 hypothetical protein JTE88_03560 [Arcanobacterium phocisimile]
MAFIDLIQQLADESSPLVDRAGELRVALAADPNDREAFEELISIIWALGQSHPTVDPLTADEEPPHETPIKLVLWALSEDLASDSRAWYPLIQLARLSIKDDAEAAVHQIEVAAGREETGLALEQGISLLVAAGYPDTAMQIGMGRWNPQEHIVGVGVALTKAAIASGKLSDAQRFISYLDERFAHDHDVLDIKEELAQLL